MIDSRPVRAAEQLDWSALETYLRARLPACDIPGFDASLPMQAEQFPGGHSNLTYLVRFGDVELVVRRPPFGPVPPSAHDMAREFRWLSAVHPVFPLAPRAYLVCDDPAVVGSVFYVMERRRGLVVRQSEPPQLEDQPAMRRRVSESMVRTLAALHAIDVTHPPLSMLGKPAGFVERQVKGWTDRWHGSRLDPVPELDAVAAWLIERLPPAPNPPAIVHGDFKLDNVMLDADDVGRMVAVFDWEMSALGDPLIDLGILLTYWTPDSPRGGSDTLAVVTDLPGWFTRDELLACYVEHSGRDVSNIRFYETFAVFKVAIVVQQIYYRFRRGQTDDPRFAVFGERVQRLARRAAELAALSSPA